MTSRYQQTNPQAGPHVRNPGKVPSLMTTVLIALLPATVFGIYIFGLPALNTVVLCLLSAFLFESLCVWLVKKRIRLVLFDGSALLTGLLLALTLPPWAPWWISVGGTGFAIIVGKHVYGGLGQNPFNPAMLARVALLLSFPLQMTAWVNPAPLFSANSPGVMDSLFTTFGGMDIPDALSGATLLGQVKTDLGQGLGLNSLLVNYYDPLLNGIGFTSGSLGETSSLLILLGGVYLIWRGIINWQLPLSLLISVTVISSLFYGFNPEQYASPLYHLSSGALMLGAFFILTDPVTTPATIRGQVIFGTSCGLLVYVIRTWGGYPEGVAFAVLLMNGLTPLIDHYFKPRQYGRNRQGSPLAMPSLSDVKSRTRS
ncbi:RnfABCDGE type electron transport complex subunit D [Motiliproteus sp. MSK22-1]|uniref:RnfABCDGE type electron transport complex subunit D n=1 Tax=Motiliproteus sp. MSK22-1 TaxID=1897630 RepID=UPI0009775B5E|nr:RnfABCDGE type electron transport complex subunit D [Motiliproteus sp. MSK22-1]OMH37952.1 electron transporter RnfD [Motiliproteus sp. MSK22-1]